MSQLELKVHPVRHTKPCSECPFRRCAPEGWLGGTGTPSEFTMAVTMEMPISCHKTRGTKKEAMCAGSLIYMLNQLMRPRNPALAVAMRMVKKDLKAVFQWPHEFVKHHSKDWSKKGVTQRRKKL